MSLHILIFNNVKYYILPMPALQQCHIQHSSELFGQCWVLLITFTSKGIWRCPHPYWTNNLGFLAHFYPSCKGRNFLHCSTSSNLTWKPASHSDVFLFKSNVQEHKAKTQLSEYLTLHLTSCLGWWRYGWHGNGWWQRWIGNERCRSHLASLLNDTSLSCY